MTSLHDPIVRAENEHFPNAEGTQASTALVPGDEFVQVSTSCDICRLLQPPWPILSKRDVLLESKCPCCKLIRTILHPYLFAPYYSCTHRAISIDFVDKYMLVKLIGNSNADRDISLHVNAVEGIFVSEVLKRLQCSNGSSRNTMPLAKYT
jgi:hypothetical protein